MTDDKTLVEELRRWEYGHSEIHDAADRIEALIAELEQLRSEIAKIVAWLRTYPEGYDIDDNLVDAIEAGEHLK